MEWWSGELISWPDSGDNGVVIESLAPQFPCWEGELAEGVGFEPEKGSSPIFAKTLKTRVFIRVFSLLAFLSQTAFAKQNEGFLSLIVPKK